MANVTYELTKVGNTTFITTKIDGNTTAQVGINISTDYYIDSSQIYLQSDINSFVNKFRFDENNVTVPAGATDIDSLFDLFKTNKLFSSESSGGGGAAGATEANQVLQIQELQQIVTLFTDLYAEQRIDFEVKQVEDSNGDIFLLRITWDENNSTYTIDYVDAQGNSATPVGVIKFLSPNALLQNVINVLTELKDNELNNIDASNSNILSKVTSIDNNTNEIETKLQTIIDDKATEAKQDIIIQKLENGLFEEIPAWVIDVSTSTGLYPFTSTIGVEFDDSTLTPITSFNNPSNGALNNPTDLLNYLRINTSDFNFDLDSSDNLVVTPGNLEVDNLFRIDFLNGPQIGNGTLTTALESTQKSILDSLNLINSRYVKLEKVKTFLSVNDTSPTVTGKIVDHLGVSVAPDIISYSLRFHGTGGLISTIPCEDGKTYSYSSLTGPLFSFDVLQVPTSASPVTGLQGIEITFTYL